MGLLLGHIHKAGKEADETVPDKMFGAVSRQNPDENARWTEKNVIIGNCRTITDLEHLIITADARIDNRHALASILGINATLLNDGQLILLAFHRWGKKCVDHLEGEFAFAIWNKTDRELFAATDPVGFRPFFFYDSEDTFIFCSEIKGLTAVKTTPDVFNEDALIDYYFRKGSPGHTYNKDISSLCGGSTLSLRDGITTIEKYWTLQPNGKYNFQKDQDWYDCLLELLYNAVEKRLDYENPAGLTLSGGLDSSCLTFILSDLLRKKNQPLYTFSSVLPAGHRGIEKDERKYIESLGRHFPNIIQTFVDAPEIGSVSSLKESFLMDESIPNPFHYLDKALLKAAGEKNIHTLFTGYGGDFGVSWKGDTVIYQLIRKGKYREVYQLLKEFRNQENHSVLYLFMKKYLPHTDTYQFLRPLLKKGKINWQNETTLKADFIKKHKQRIQNNPLKDFRLQTRQMINEGRLGKIIAVLHNRNAAFSMGSAVPFLDKSVLEFLMDIPPSFFVKGGLSRSLMRNILRGNVPEEISRRKDKLPYSPGYQNIIKQQKPLFEAIVHSDEYAFVFDRYIDKNKIINHFDEIIPEEGFTTAENVVAIRIKQAANAAVVMKHLKEENYTFKG